MFLLKLMVIGLSSASDEGNSFLNASCQLFLCFLQSNPVNQISQLFHNQCFTIRLNLMRVCDTVFVAQQVHIKLITSLNEYSYLILILNFQNWQLHTSRIHLAGQGSILHLYHCGQVVLLLQRMEVQSPVQDKNIR